MCQWVVVEKKISFGGGCRPRPSYLPLSVEEVTMGFLSPEEKTGQENHCTWFLLEINQSASCQTRLIKATYIDLSCDSKCDG